MAAQDDVGVVRGVASSPDGRLFATCGDAHVAVWHFDTGMHVRTLQHRSGPGGFICVAWRRDGSLLASGSTDGSVTVCDVVTAAVKVALQGHRNGAALVAWSPDGLKLCTGSFDTSCRMWDGNTGSLLLELKGWGKETVGCSTGTEGEPLFDLMLSWSPDGAFVPTARLSYEVNVWDVTTGAEMRSMRPARFNEPCPFPVMCVAWSPDGTMLASGYQNSTVRVWYAATGTIKCTLELICGRPSTVAWSPAGKHLALQAVL